MLSSDTEEKAHGPDGVLPAKHFFTWKACEPVKLRRDESEFAADPVDTVVDTFERIVRQRPKGIAMIDTFDDVHDSYTYETYRELVVHVAKVFIKLGLERHHGVGILGYNSPQWFISHLASIYAGGLSAGIYSTNSPEICRYIVANSESNIVVVEDDRQMQKMLEVWPQLPKLRAVIQYRGELRERRQGLYTWNDVLKMDTEGYDEALKERLKTLAPNKCCTLIYTSGTTGDPKGAMLSHDNILWTLKVVVKCLDEGRHHPDTVVSYLPLNHIAALMVDIYWPLATGGGTVYFSRPDALKGTLVKTLREARPTIFFGVPRVWEKFMETLIEAEKKQSATGDKNNNKEEVSGKENDAEAGNRTKLDVKTLLGLDRSRINITGAAPCRLEVLEYFLSRDVPVMEIYGMSESTGPQTTNLPGHVKYGSVGRTLPGLRTKLEASTDEGLEICMDGRHVFMGYLNEETKTRETFDSDFWLRTGDVGVEDEDGFIYIVARIKELIITAGGENIAPVPIESRVLKELPCLGHCMLVGEKQKYLSVLLTLKTEVDHSSGSSTDKLERSSLEWCRKAGCKWTKVSEIISSKDRAFEEAIQRGIDRANEGAISRAQKIQKWTLLPRDFTIAGGELGPTLKMRRSEICKIYKTEVDSFY